LSVGFVVDDAIVMLENAVRHVEAGESPFVAALNGAREIGFTIVTMTVSLAAVFIPILFMAGILGRLFREFAVTIVSAVFISGVVSLTLTPMLCSRFLRVIHAKTGFAGFIDREFDRLREAYARSLRAVLRHRLVMLAVFAGVLYATVKMFGIVPKGFIPDQDNDSLRIQLRAAQGTSYYEMVGYTQRIADILKQNPYIDSLMANTGGGGGGQNTARFAIQLTPRAGRKFSAQEIAQQLRGPLGRFPEFRSFVTIPSSLRIGGFRGNSAYNLTVQSLNNEELYTWAPKLERAIAELPGIQDVSDDMEIKSPRVRLVIDRDKAAVVGLSAVPITQSLADGFGPQWVSTI
jgi:HAE1 family hydrophobic/amphiphilic exporter-1